MNKLRAFSYGGGALLLALSAWAAFRYGGSPLRYAEGLVIGAIAAAVPAGATRLKAAVGSLRRRRSESDGSDDAHGAVFVSESTVSDPIDRLEAIVEAVRDDDDYDGVERDSFGTGPGLTVAHDGFHESLVRISEGGRIVVTGASARTRALVETAGRACSVSFERSDDNPFRGVEPVRGAPRVFLGLLVFAVVLAGVNATGAAAYPADVYNPAERTVLMGADAQADFDPRVSATDARLRKAAFLVAVVDEEATEVRWEGNDTEAIAAHGRQALRASDDARALLRSVREGPSTPAQIERADRIEAKLHKAEGSVAASLADRTSSDAVEDVAPLRRVGGRLRAAANSSVTAS